MMWRVAYKLELGMLSYQANYNPYLVNEKKCIFTDQHDVSLFIYFTKANVVKCLL